MKSSTTGYQLQENNQMYLLTGAVCHPPHGTFKQGELKSVLYEKTGILHKASYTIATVNRLL